MNPVVKEKLIRFLQGDSNINEEQLAKLGIKDPELEHILLMNLFTSGNYTRTGGSNWHDKPEHKLFTEDIEDITIYPDTREELLTMPLINDFSKGSDASISRQPRVKEKDKFGYDWRVDIAKNGDVTVHLKEIDLRDTVTSKNDTVTTYTWTYGQGTIVHFLKEHPLSTYDNIRRIGLLNKAFFDIMSDRARSISRYNLETAAWYKCLLTVFMRVGYEEYYDNIYDVSRMLRDQPRFLDIQEDTGKFYDGAL